MDDKQTYYYLDTVFFNKNGRTSDVTYTFVITKTQLLEAFGIRLGFDSDGDVINLWEIKTNIKYSNPVIIKNVKEIPKGTSWKQYKLVANITRFLNGCNNYEYFDSYNNCKKSKPFLFNHLLYSCFLNNQGLFTYFCNNEYVIKFNKWLERCENRYDEPRGPRLLKIGSVVHICESEAVDKLPTLTNSNLATSNTTEIYFNNSTEKTSWVSTSIETTEETCRRIIKETLQKENKEKEKNKMLGTSIENFKFGKLSGDAANKIRMSIYGTAISSSDGKFSYYNKEDGTFMDITDFLIDGMSSMFYLMPIAQKEVQIGDIICHKNNLVIVTGYNDDNALTCADPYNLEQIVKVPRKNVFGFNFYTKVVNLCENMFTMTAPTNDNPFGTGNLLPFLFMNRNGGDNDNMMLMMMMAQNGQNEIFSNPMMMYMLMKDGNKSDDMLPFLLMSGANPFGTQKKPDTSKPTRVSKEVPVIKG